MFLFTSIIVISIEMNTYMYMPLYVRVTTCRMTGLMITFEKCYKRDEKYMMYMYISI